LGCYNCYDNLFHDGTMKWCSEKYWSECQIQRIYVQRTSIVDRQIKFLSTILLQTRIKVRNHITTWHLLPLTFQDLCYHFVFSYLINYLLSYRYGTLILEFLLLKSRFSMLYSQPRSFREILISNYRCHYFISGQSFPV